LVTEREPIGVVAAVVRADWLALDSMLVAPTVVFLSPKTNFGEKHS
jgi:hypothetical protein